MIKTPELDKIKVGDRVEVLSDSCKIVKTGSKGKVVEFDEGFIGVELDERIGEHNCHGLAKDGHGWYFCPIKLKVIEGE